MQINIPGESMKFLATLIATSCLLLSFSAYAKEPYSEFCADLLPLEPSWDTYFEKINEAKEYLAKKEIKQKTTISEDICLAKLYQMSYSFSQDPNIMHIDESNRLLSEVFSKEPGNHFAHVQLSFNSLSDYEIEQAEELFESAKKGLVPKRTLDALEIMLRAAKGECKWFIENLRTVKKMGYPAIYGLALHSSANCLIEEGNVGAALGYTRTQTKTTPSFSVFVRASQLASQLEYWDEAITYAETALRLRQWRLGYEALAAALTGKGVSMLQKTEEYDVALSYLEFAHKYDPTSVKVLIQIADAYMFLADKSLGIERIFVPYKEKAVFYTEKILELDPSNPQANKIVRELARLRM